MRFGVSDVVGDGSQCRTMSYHDPYERSGPPPAGYADPYRRRRDGADRVATVIHVVTSVIVGIFVLHVLFVLADANRLNDFVQLIYYLAQIFVLGFGDVFTPEDAVLGVVLNYGFAALIYLAVSQLVIKALRRP